MPRPNRDRFCLYVMMLAGVLLAASTGAQTPDTRTELPAGFEQALNEKLSRIASLHAHFRQYTIGREGKFAQQQSGELWVEKPDRFRIAIRPPDAQTLVSDGDVFWSYDSDLEQVIIRKLDKSVREVPILLLGGEPAAITRQYHINHYEDDDGERFVLEPRSANSLFQSLTIAFKGNLPSAISIRDNLDQQTRMELIDPAVNVQMDASMFTFSPPAGVDVIDDRQS